MQTLNHIAIEDATTELAIWINELPAKQKALLMKEWGLTASDIDVDPDSNSELFPNKTAQEICNLWSEYQGGETWVTEECRDTGCVYFVADANGEDE